MEAHLEAATARGAEVRPVRHPRVLALGRRLLDQSLNVYAGLALIYLLAPIAVIVVFSFNDPQSRFNFVWHGFTLDNWKDPFGVPGLTEALGNSLKIAALSTVVATILGTMMALALVRYRFRGRAPTNFFIFLPLATPEVVLGASLLSLFLTLGFATGFTTIVIAHIMFNISFVVVTVRSRLIGFDRHLEEAAQDLGANGLQTFMRVTLPLIAPGVFAAALLAFALSVDDFVITNFNAGSTVTFPLFVWGAARVAVPPQINIIATMIFVATLFFMFLTVLQQRRAERMAAVRPESPEV
jgi:spermidine/putrescine transport system permease protein